MDISFKQFVRLTVLLAAGSAALPGCKVVSEEDTKASGGAGSSSTAGQGSGGEEVGASGSAGTGTAGSSGEEQGGTAGTPSDEGLGGSAGTPSDEGLGGSAGTPSDEGLGGSAGTPSDEGLGGAAGAPACVAGDPAEEGAELDCSTLLSYAGEECPDPVGEGITITHALRVCERYAGERSESAQLLVECLGGLTKPSEGWCGSVHRTEVEDCVSAMEAQTCTPSNAQTICEATHESCAAVSVEECVRDVGPLAEAEYADLATCAVMDASYPKACHGDYLSSCLQMPDRLLSTEEACASVMAGCAELTEEACLAGLETQASTGQIWESMLRMTVNFCVPDYETNAAMNCAEAWTACTTS